MPDARLHLPRSFQNRLSSLGEFLIRPPASLNDPEARQQSRLLLAILVGFQISGGLTLLFEGLTHPSALDDFDYWLGAGIWLIGFGLYAWARRGPVNGPATVLIALLFLLFVVAPFTPDSLSSLPYLVVIPLLLTALFFPIRYTVWFTALAMGVPIVLMLIISPAELTTRQIITENVLFILPIGCIVLIYIRHHDLLERIRQAELQAAYDRALASEAELEQRVEARTRDLREAQHRYRALFEQTHDAVFILDLEGRYLEVNRRATEMLGYSAQEMGRLTFRDLTLESDTSEQIHKRLLAGQDIPVSECVFRTKDGSHLPIEVNIELVRDLDGKPLHIQSVARGISARKQMEDELRASHAELDHFFTLALDLLCIADTEGYFIKVNKAWEDILGYATDALRGRRFLDFVHPDDLQATHDSLALLAIQQPVFNFTNRYRASDGSYRYIEWRSYPVGKLIYAAARDVTERKQAEEALRLSEQRLDLTLRSTQAGTWEWHIPTGELRINERWAEIVGYSLDELAPTTIRTWIDLVHPQDMQTTNQLLEAHFSGNADFECEIRMKHKAGHWVWVWDRGMVMEWTEDHKPLRMFGTHIDITVRKEAEQRTFELALEKERVRLLRQFIEKASHEFRTPLSIINSTTFLMLKSMTPANLSAKIKIINEQVVRMTRLVSTLLMMTRLESGATIESSRVDIVTILDIVCQGMITQYGYSPALQQAIPPDLPPILGNLNDLQDALRQILDNAYRFTPVTGTITVTAGTSNDHLWLEVSDTGSGIPEPDLPHIFETFWRQDEAHSTPGLGLGLPIAHKIIQAHGGTIEARSAIGQGTTIRIVLPVPVGIKEGSE